MEEKRIIRCNWCEHIFLEDLLLVDEEEEQCPDCGSIGHLMDLGIAGQDKDEILFPNLSKSKDWGVLKTEFPIDALCDFENDIHDYEYGVGNEDIEDYPTIVQWWEIDVITEEFAVEILNNMFI